MILVARTPQNSRLSSTPLPVFGQERCRARWPHDIRKSSVPNIETPKRGPSVFGAPSTIATTNRRTRKIKLSKSTSCHRILISSPLRRQVKVSNSKWIRQFLMMGSVSEQHDSVRSCNFGFDYRAANHFVK